MILINFTIQDQIALKTEDGYYFDLHNDFKFINIKYNVKRNSVTLNWRKSKRNWTTMIKVEHIELQFKNIELFQVNYIDVLNSQDDKLALSFIGYLHPDDVNMMDGSLPTNRGDDKYHIILGFQNGMSIKLFSEEVSLIYTNRC